MKTVWVTGAGGFIGKNLLEQAPKDWDIYTLSHLPKYGKKNLCFNAMHCYGGLDKLPYPDKVIYLGGISKPSDSYSNVILCNVDPLRNILEYLNRHSFKNTHIVFASTINVYGKPSYVVDEYAITRPTTLYAASKAMAEQMLLAYQSINPKIQISILRLTAVVGKYMTHGIIYDLVKKLKSGSEKLELLGNNPGTYKSYVHIDDVIQYILKGPIYAPYINNVVNYDAYDAISSHSVAKHVQQILSIQKDITFSGESFTGDCDAPLVESAFSNKLKYASSKDALIQGIKDYLCSIS